MLSASRSYDLVILGSGIAGLAAALAAHALGLQPVVLEKAATLGGGTVHSYGLIWVGQNHLAQAAGHGDTRDDVLGQRVNDLQAKFPTPRNRELIRPYQGFKSAHQGSFPPDQGTPRLTPPAAARGAPG